MKISDAQAGEKADTKEDRPPHLSLTAHTDATVQGIGEQQKPGDIRQKPPRVGRTDGKGNPLPPWQGYEIQAIDVVEKNAMGKNEVQKAGDSIESGHQKNRPPPVIPGVKPDKPHEGDPEKHLEGVGIFEKHGEGSHVRCPMHPDVQYGGSSAAQRHDRKDQVDFRLGPSQENGQVQQTDSQTNTTDKNVGTGQKAHFLPALGSLASSARAAVRAAAAPASSIFFLVSDEALVVPASPLS